MAKSTFEFTAKHWDLLQSAKRDLHDALPIMDKAESCGTDCQEFRHIHSEILRNLELIEQHFMPSKPPR